MSTPTKPDRFEKMVEKCEGNVKLFEAIISSKDAVTLLRKEHQGVRRLVLKMQKPFLVQNARYTHEQSVARLDMCAEIIAALVMRR